MGKHCTTFHRTVNEALSAPGITSHIQCNYTTVNVLSRSPQNGLPAAACAVTAQLILSWLRGGLRAPFAARQLAGHDLRQAIERREFELHFQPIVKLASASVAGFEALVRWRHPTEGLLGPDRFLSVAEETGLARELGLWTIEEACSRLRD